MNEDTRRVFVQRSRIIQEIRAFLLARGYLEVDTPMMQPIPGGAAARPFITHHNALDMDLYLRIAPELYLKRLVVGGFEKVFEMNRNFRNEGISTRHNPEFSMLEFYTAYQTYEHLMTLIEQMLREVAQTTLGGTAIVYQGQEIDLARPYQRLTIADAIRQYHPVVTEATLPRPRRPDRQTEDAGDRPSPRRRPGRPAAHAVREHGGAAARPADVHRGLPDRGVSACPSERPESGHHRAFRAVHRGPRDG
jgi:lysyl-tRNA synthetase class II